MNNLDSKATEQTQDNRTAAAVAAIWGVLFALVIGFELASLLMSRSMLAGVFH